MYIERTLEPQLFAPPLGLRRPVLFTGVPPRESPPKADASGTVLSHGGRLAGPEQITYTALVVCVVNITRNQVLGERIERARSFRARLRGLIGRRDWDDLDGLWLEPCTGVHGLAMRFALDVVLVDASHVVLWTQQLRPWCLGKMDLRALAALELPLGRVEETGTICGDRLVVDDN